LCSQCRRQSPAPPEIVQQLGLDRFQSGPISLWHPVGCSSCRGTGYRGRLAIAEFLVPNEAIEHLIFSRADHAQIERAAIDAGMIPMFTSGLMAALAGHTTIEEVAGAVRGES